MKERQATFVRSRAELCSLAKLLKVRPDWHEPDEQELSLAFGGYDFDNACISSEDENHVIILQRGYPVARVNMAMLLAWATGLDNG